jgi:thioredoxin reductase (NADPH)
MLQALADIPEMSDIIVTVFAARRRRLIGLRQPALGFRAGELAFQLRDRRADVRGRR